MDLCAAPGGKTTHILEVAPEAQVVAVDIDEQRLSRVYDNLKRLGMKATVKQGDGRYPSQWCGEQQFDRILLDAPCSATGVIRRHPDIKWLRRPEDIAELAAQCRFRDCTHTNEPRCAVRQALENGQLSKERFELYRSLHVESRKSADMKAIAKARKALNKTRKR